MIPEPDRMTEEERDERRRVLLFHYIEKSLSYAEYLAASAIYVLED